MVEASRRLVLAQAASLAAGAPGREALGSAAEAQRILERYQAFGDKASGGHGDTACGAWLIQELEALGYRCARQPIEAPAYEGPPPTLACGAARAELIPQAIVQPTPPDGLAAPLRRPGAARGAIALIELPHARWSTAKGEVERRVRAVLADGALAAILVTNGPTGEACALNAPADRPLFDRPVAVLAPRQAGPFLAAAEAGAAARLTMAGRSFRRPAFNVTANLGREARSSLVLSTPRSGWFGCAGERGTGLAAWLLLARWAARARLPVDVALVATTGHEYEYAGGERYIAEVAPTPERTALWVHLGANVAARDWHERNPPLPLPSADPQRYLLASPTLLTAARAAFKGQPGLEQAYPAERAAAAGELASILTAGYDPVIGVFGAHRFHHTRADDLACVSAELIAPVARAFAQVIAQALDAKPGARR